MPDKGPVRRRHLISLYTSTLSSIVHRLSSILISGWIKERERRNLRPDHFHFVQYETHLHLSDTFSHGASQLVYRAPAVTRSSRPFVGTDTVFSFDVSGGCNRLEPCTLVCRNLMRYSGIPCRCSRAGLRGLPWREIGPGRRVLCCTLGVRLVIGLEWRCLSSGTRQCAPRQLQRFQRFQRWVRCQKGRFPARVTLR